jgi:mRNA-degrading endonuclease toxin of MazEF toxin-antitoxin module
MIPLTTNVDRVLPGEALVDLHGRQQKALGSQLRTVSKLRIGKQLGEISSVDLEKVERAVLFQLGISI